MQLSIDLTAAWNRLVVKGAIRNRFVDAHGREIESGVRMGAGGLESYAIAVETGLDLCEGAEWNRLASGIEILYNPVGKLKPHRAPTGPGRQAAIEEESSACPLACQNPENPLSILRRSPLAQIPCPNLSWRAYPNVAPWEAHGILIWLPCAAEAMSSGLPHLPQVLDYQHVEDFLAIAQASTGMTTFFNSLHGGASANHLHFQAVHSARAMAADSASRVTHGPYSLLRDYPASGLAFAPDVTAPQLWEPIAKIRAAGYPFNVISLISGIYVFVRDPRNEVLAEFPGRAFGAINLAGLFITSDAQERRGLNDAAIAAAYTKLTLGGKALLELLEVD